MADNKSNTSEAALGWGILLIVFAALAYLIWRSFSEQIMAGLRWLRYAEMWVMSFFIPKDYTVTWNGEQVNFHDAMELTRNLPADRIDGTFLSLASTVALNPFIYFLVPMTLYFAFWALFKGPGSEHRQAFDLDGLIKKQSNMFPVISPFIGFNPSSQPPRAPGAPVPVKLPLFAEALGPEEWVAYNEIPVPDGVLDQAAAAQAFAKQLGPRWRGAKHLAPYKQILLAACCLKASRKRADADALLGRLARCWSEKGLSLSKDSKLIKEARAVLNNRDLAASTLKKCNEHAWETTALLRALNTAREEGGVLAPAQFVWLRGYDRTLWYPLNNLGRQSYHMEAIGAMAHYKAEKMAQRPIPRPKMNDPVQSIAEYMTSNKARPIPQLDYSGSDKRGIKKLKTA